MSNYRFILERYRGRNTRYTCPQCGRKYTFTRYIDTENNNQYISDNVGKCNRLDKCGYHYAPRQYYTDNPHKRDKQIVPFHKNIGFWNGGTERYAKFKPTVSVLADACIKAYPQKKPISTQWLARSALFRPLCAYTNQLKTKKPDLKVELLKSGYQDSNGAAVAGIPLGAGRMPSNKIVSIPATCH